MSPLLEAVAVSYTVGGAELLHAVDLTVAAGELVAVIGPNGAGKSTLVGVLAGDLAPTSGSVTIAGVGVAETDGAELAMRRAVLGQGRTVGIPFKVSEVVAMGAARAVANDSTVRAAMEAMDVGGLADRIVGSLSGGEHTRVELARILAQATDLILLDEPLGALDVAHQERVMRHLRTVAAAGRGVLAVFHDLNAAAAHADRFVLLAEGRVVAAGAAEEVLHAEVLSAVYGHPMTVTRIGRRLVVLPAD